MSSGSIKRIRTMCAIRYGAQIVEFSIRPTRRAAMVAFWNHVRPKDGIVSCDVATFRAMFPRHEPVWVMLAYWA